MASEADVELEREESASPSFSANTAVTTPSPTAETNDLLDDVFGSSEPSSPAPGPAIAISGPSADGGSATGASLSREHKESSDIARLRTVHSTNGYRDGLAIARDSAIQPGFDEGYSLGAAMGLKAGLVVGSFESLRRALRDVSNDRLKSQLNLLTERCRKDLSRSNLFSPEYIDQQGTWKWDAPADATLHEVAAGHPVIKAWLLKSDTVLHRLGIGPEKLEIRWAEPETRPADATPKAKAVKLPLARGGEAGQSGQTFDF